MKRQTFGPKRAKAKNGAGRQVKLRCIMLPTDIADELRTFRDCYSAIEGRRITYEQVIRLWMEHAKESDKILAEHLDKADRTKQQAAENKRSSIISINPKLLEKLFDNKMR